ncbi:MAG: HlyD family efflux transporter periplasmic adaptor subunit [Pirellulaceae bacterium]|nr:HlyD family efflux transporter periplasmic adaptor subunit [Pirellulaceae bacterium]
MLFGSIISYRNSVLGIILVLIAGGVGIECCSEGTVFGQERTLPLPPRLPGTANGNSNSAAPSQSLRSIPGHQLPPPMTSIEQPEVASGQLPSSAANPSSTIHPVSSTRSNGNLSAPVEVSADGHLRVPVCLVIVIEKIQLPARESGVLGQLIAKEGQLVTGGSMIAKVDDSQADTELESSKRRLEASQLKVSSDIAIQYASAAKETAEKTFKREEGLFRKGASTEMKRDEAYLASVQADLQLKKANHDFQVDQKAVKLEEIQVTKAQQLLDRHAIIAPWTGVVTKTLKRESEWVNAGDPILELVQMDRIWIEGSLDPSVIHPYQVSDKAAVVTLNLPGGEKVAFDGRITFVDTQVIGDKYKVRAEVLNRQIENHWLLVPGMYVSMEIILNHSPADRVSHQ